MNSDGHTIYTQLDMKVMVDGETGDGMHGIHFSEGKDWYGYTVYTQLDMKVMVDGEKGDGLIE